MRDMIIIRYLRLASTPVQPTFLFQNLQPRHARIIVLAARTAYRARYPFCGSDGYRMHWLVATTTTSIVLVVRLLSRELLRVLYILLGYYYVASYWE
jgi:hypothetical protein